MKKNILHLRKLISPFVVIAMVIGLVPFMEVEAAPAITVVFINEIHYDNEGTDAGEAIEIAGPAGTDLTGWSLVLYNGSGGVVYDTDYFSEVIPSQQSGYGTIVMYYPSNGIQNGPPDGIALVDSGNNVVQFLSYEGSFTATDGPALGMTSVDIGVAEDSTTLVGYSMQLSGTGAIYEDFTWNTPTVDTFGVVNTEQTFVAPASEPKINEFSASTTGTDVEYVEIYGDPDTDYSTYTVLEIEGDSDSAMGAVDEVIAVGTTGANGLWNIDLLANTLENGSITLLLVKDFSGILGDDIDADNDGVIDFAPWDAIVDSVAVNDGGAGDVTYGVPTLGVSYDGLPYAPGGASRYPDGLDTDAATDWVRNDFDLAGIDGYVGTIILGEAYNTPGEPNEIYEPEPEACGDPFTPIYEVQGNGLTSPVVGTEVVVEGIVVGDFQNNGSLDNGDLNGFHLQDAIGDDDPATSDGVFIYYSSGTLDVEVGDVVRVRGIVSEYNGLTEITVSQIWDCESTGSIAPTTVSLPVTDIDDLEPFEGMLVTFPQELVISEYYNYDRYGEMVLGLPFEDQDRLYTPTSVVEPGQPAIDLAAENSLRRVTLDDGLSSQNPAVLRHPNGDPFGLTNLFRGGDLVANATGVLDQYYSAYRIQPTAPADYTAINPRPETKPDVGGSLQIAAMNMLNFFITADYPTGDPLDNKCGPDLNMECRGWDFDQPDEFTRQRTKLLQALFGLDAAVIGLNEIENTTGVEPLADLVAGLNDLYGYEAYAYIDTGVIGTDAIKVGMIYRIADVTPIGDYALLTSAVDPRFIDTLNRPTLAQTFEENGSGERFTVAVNHLKSKGSACDGDPDLGDGQGNCNITRTLAAQALVDWLATDPTGSGDADFIIMGDLNSYAMEDPIDAIKAGADDILGTADDYTNLIFDYMGLYAYSYVFDGQVGYLDQALANLPLASQVTGTAVWHINADESDVLDYDTSYKPPEQELLYEPNEFRTSDHDAVIVGLSLTSQPVLHTWYLPFSFRNSVVHGTPGALTESPHTYALNLDADRYFERPTGWFLLESGLIISQ